MFSQIYRQLIPATLLLAALAPHANSQIFVYNQTNGLGAITTLAAGQPPNTIAVGSMDAGYSVVTSVGDTVLLYNGQTGAASLQYISSSGGLYHLKDYVFSSGWSQIVSSNGVILFYNAQSGLAVTGNICCGDSSFTQYPTVLQFSPGWTHIVATDQGALYFYNANDGSGAVGYLQPVWNDPSCANLTGFGCYVVDAQFIQKSSYAPGYFTTGWTHIVDTDSGILFYRSGDGLNVMVNIDPNTGVVSTLSGTVQNLAPGWTSIAAQPGSILFYQSSSGDVAMGHILRPREVVNPKYIGAVHIDSTYPGYFSTGWDTAIRVFLAPQIN